MISYSSYPKGRPKGSRDELIAKFNLADHHLRDIVTFRSYDRKMNHRSDYPTYDRDTIYFYCFTRYGGENTKGIGEFVLHHLCHNVLLEGKKMWLFCNVPKLYGMYERQGFKRIYQEGSYREYLLS